MKLFASILLILSFAVSAAAQNPTATGTRTKYTIFSVSNVVQVEDNVYTAEKNTVDAHGEATAGDIVYQHIAFKTEGCMHVPGSGATAIYIQIPDGSVKLLFSDGGTCKVDVTESTYKK